MKRSDFEFNEEYNPAGCWRFTKLAILWFSLMIGLIVVAVKCENKQELQKETICTKTE